MQKRKTTGILPILGILAVFTLPQSTQVISPAINSLSEFYPDVPYSTVLMLASIVSLIVIPCSTIAGNLAGRKLSYRALSLIAILTVLVGGFAPYFVMDSFPLMLISRAILGIGVGISSPISGALIMRLIPEKRQAFWQGIGSGVMNVFGVIFQSLSGMICMVDLRSIWLLYLIVLIPLALAFFFLPEPEKTEHLSTVKKEKVTLPIGVIFTCIGFGLLYHFLSPVLSNISSILVQEGLGTAATAGTILSAYSIGGMIAGFVFGGVYKLLGRWVTPVSLVFQALGLWLAAYTYNVFTMAAGVVIFGVAIHWVWPDCVMQFRKLPGTGGAAASGLFISCMHTGTFLAAPAVGLIQSISGSDLYRLPTQVGCIGTIAVAVIWIIAKLLADRKKG